MHWEEECIQSFGEKTRTNQTIRMTDICGRIILRQTLKKYDDVVWNEQGELA
jgi:hypothetical protein